MAKSKRQQAAIAIQKKKGSIGKLFKQHRMDRNKDGRINKSDFRALRKRKRGF